MGLTDYGRGVVGYQGCLGGGCSAVSPAVAGRGGSSSFPLVCVSSWLMDHDLYCDSVVGCVTCFVANINDICHGGRRPRLLFCLFFKLVAPRLAGHVATRATWPSCYFFVCCNLGF